mgnify:CR=1 FL=1
MSFVNLFGVLQNQPRTFLPLFPHPPLLFGKNNYALYAPVLCANEMYVLNSPLWVFLAVNQQ